MGNKLKFWGTLVGLFIVQVVFAQDHAQQNTETGLVNEFFRSNEKIYVAAGALVIIFICIILYLVRLEKRLKKLEQ
jgi:ABC-type glycerol-3-phosphate transport system permease component